MEVLLTGGRVDCWDGDKGEPIIYHGHTLTSKISFRETLAAINAYAFQASDYPVILSIENHCSVKQQSVMAAQFKAVFGNKLYTKPLRDSVTKLPSPAELKGKIIIKAKKLPAGAAVASDGYVSEEDESEDESARTGTLSKKMNTKNSTKKKQVVSLDKSLSDCVVICQSVSFKGFSHAQENYNFKQMCSYSENKAFALAKNEPESWLEHNMRHLSRIYPAGWRTDSSNYDPMPLWMCGNQIVALNYQTPDDPMQINNGMFLDNGGCGYVLKPAIMTDNKEPFRPNGPYPSAWKRKLKIHVISGYQLPKKKGDSTFAILDPLVKVDVVGVPMDTVSQKTKVQKKNGFNPVWEEILKFTVNVPDLALIYFRVLDSKIVETSKSGNELVAQYCLPFRCLQTGYRTIHLKSKYGEPILGSSLFIKTTITRPRR